MNYVRLSPQPAQFHTMPDWFAPRVEVDTDQLTIERGVWLACTPQLADSITRRADLKEDATERARVLNLAEEVFRRIPVDA